MYGGIALGQASAANPEQQNTTSVNNAEFYPFFTATYPASIPVAAGTQ